ncbi:hypothetical protein T265_12706 [Opisthorchis viverrini]|uniref:MD-2-related lipid-recognition domain-containing protein n=1 Tax=Opisthorchis viverrini TaxID=6198 RepID=A0A075A3W1_OPIVI|nr:hypothetical protein T265_12706 [Opisthorchis viverrini]KER32967.1 hypothetical protein T265_12706 [Opisthorchis viverrini]
MQGIINFATVVLSISSQHVTGKECWKPNELFYTECSNTHVVRAVALNSCIESPCELKANRSATLMITFQPRTKITQLIPELHLYVNFFLRPTFNPKSSKSFSESMDGTFPLEPGRFYTYTFSEVMPARTGSVTATWRMYDQNSNSAVCVEFPVVVVDPEDE